MRGSILPAIVIAWLTVGWPVAAQSPTPAGPAAAAAPGTSAPAGASAPAVTASPAARTAPGGTPPGAAAPAAPVASAAPFTYQPAGRRDPFVSLLSRGSEGRSAPGARSEGLEGLAVSEISVRGVLQTPAGFVAILQAPDSKAYLARPNDRLLDGTIKAITAQGLVILQRVTDPLSPAKTREVRKGLRSAEEGT